MVDGVTKHIAGAYATYAKWATPKKRQYIMSIDQGTTSTRCVIFDENAQVVSISQREHGQIFPRPGWVEHDPDEILRNVRRVIADAAATADIGPETLAAIGITNQRETTIVWDRATGRPIHNAIVWQDTRTDSYINSLSEAQRALIIEKTGLTPSAYFSASKIRWILDNVSGARARAEAGALAFGTIDTWLVWELTRKSSGTDAARHVTDVTNASRTMLMDLETQTWDPELLELMDIPAALLPEIVSSSEVIGKVRRSGAAHGVPISGILGDQQAAAFGQACLSPGEAKNTYGTGNFLLMNTGTEIRRSSHGLITTAAYRLGNEPAHFALEGSIAMTGSLVQWLRDNLGFFDHAADIEALAKAVPDTGGCYIVPAFSGLLAPYWRPDARGIIAGLTRYVTKAHLARAALESTAFQTRDVVEAMNADAGVPLRSLRVDGGMVANNLLMQCQADQLGVAVTVPRVTETTALGAAFAAGLAVGFFKDTNTIRGLWQEDRTFEPQGDETEVAEAYSAWKKAVQLSFNWMD